MERRRETPLTVFVHIPKTAGTTLTGVLRANFPPGTVRLLGNVFHGAGRDVSRGPIEKLRRSGNVITRDIHLLGGHLPFGVREFLPGDSRYITFLRDPVERTLSHYYRILSLHRSTKLPGLPEEPSLEQMLEKREYLFDNLQTRMLSGDPEPFGDVTEKMLEQAKENLNTAFVTFGLSDRFDESLVLLKHKLGLRSILYVSQRVTTDRPRTRESKAQMVPIAERFNAYDRELYSWAAQRFEEIVSKQESDFATDLAALQAAVSDGASVAPVPSASTFSRKRLWEDLVAARAELLQWEYDYAKIDEKDPVEAVEEVRELIQDVAGRLGALETKIVTPAQASSANEPESDGADAEEPPEQRRRSRGRSRAAQIALQRERKEAHLEDIRGQIQELEEAVGDATDGGDPHVIRELDRLRSLAVEAEEELRRQDELAEQAALNNDRQRERTRAGATRRRDSALALLERTERRLEAIREQLGELDKAGSDEPTDESTSERRQTRVEKLQALLGQKEDEIVQLRERIAEAERELGELEGETTDEAADARESVRDDVVDDVLVASER